MTPFLNLRFPVGDAWGEDARGRLQGRPLAVMPLQVVAGFLESDRGRSDSGVWAMKGMVESIGINVVEGFEAV